MTPVTNISRRGFLAGACVVAGMGILAFSGLRLMRNAYWHLHPKLVDDFPAGRLTLPEMTTILALVEILVPEHILPDREGRIRIVNSNTENDGPQDDDGPIYFEYKAACKLLDKATLKLEGIQGFHLASTGQRENILRTLLWSYKAGEWNRPSYYIGTIYASLERIFQSEAERRFREYVVRDLLRAFYIQYGVAYKLADYTHWPGVPASDLRDYTRPIETELWRGHVKTLSKI
jgi:hypothetical protein